MLGTAALATAAIGGVTAPTTSENPLVAMGGWPTVPMTDTAAGANQDLAALDDAARFAQDRASRDGGRTGLDAKMAEAAERLYQLGLARERTALIDAMLARQQVLSPAGFSLPTQNYQLTAHFGNAGRLWARDHTGLDFAAPSGTSVRSIANGRVVDAGWAGAYGWRLIVRHDDGTKSWYCHLSKMLVKSGQVSAGEQIGKVGSTGNSTGPHLHLEVRPSGESAIDPESWLHQRGLDSAGLAFRADRDLPERLQPYDY